MFNHSIEKVFSCFSSSKKIGKWFSPDSSISINVVQYDFHSDGRYYLEYTLPDKTKLSLFGRFLIVEKNERIKMTWTWKKPDIHADINTIVDITLKDFGKNQTLLIIDHRDLSSNEMRERHNSGWLGTINQLTEYMEKNDDIITSY